MVSQFISPHKVKLLGDLNFKFPEGTHAIGRLDNLSEGLLILTTNKTITKRLFQASVPHKRIYLVQVKNDVSEESLLQLKSGVSIRVEGGLHYNTPPCAISIIKNPESIVSDLNASKIYTPNTWLLITLYEGKYHQVRKMVAAVKHKCKRLIRVAIEELELGDMKPGQVIEMEEKEFFRLLKIE